MSCTVVIAALADDFENAPLLRSVELLTSIKMRLRMVEMCGTVIFLINFAEIKRTLANEPNTILAFTDHIQHDTSRFLLDITWQLFLGLQFTNVFNILAIFVGKGLLQNR